MRYFALPPVAELQWVASDDWLVTVTGGPSPHRFVTAEKGLEGIVSKYRTAPYRSGHTDAWQKIKVQGWTEATGGASGDYSVP